MSSSTATPTVATTGQSQQAATEAAPNSNLAQVAHGQIMQAAMNSSGAGAQQQQQQPVMDLGSVLAKIQALEKEKADMRAHLDTVTSKLSKLQVRVAKPARACMCAIFTRDLIFAGVQAG